MLKKLCRCGKVIPTSMRRCDKCQVRYDYDVSLRNKLYDRYSRNKKSEAFYNSQEWLRTREYTLRKYKGLDLYDYFINKKITYANTAHHIIELNEDWDRRLDIKNLFPLSDRNHKRIHGKYLRDKKGTQKMLFELLDTWNKLYTEG